jgi:TolA-binding protein
VAVAPGEGFERELELEAARPEQPERSGTRGGETETQTETEVEDDPAGWLVEEVEEDIGTAGPRDLEATEQARHGEAPTETWDVREESKERERSASADHEPARQAPQARSFAPTEGESEAQLEQAGAARLVGRQSRASRQNRVADRSSEAEDSRAALPERESEADSGAAGRASLVSPAVETTSPEPLVRSGAYESEYRRLAQEQDASSEVDCGRWRDFLTRYPAGAYLADARYQLARCSVRTFEESSDPADLDITLGDIDSFLEIESEEDSGRARELSSVRRTLRNERRH